MERQTFQLGGRNGNRRESLLFRDQEGRYYLRPGCGTRLVRLTTRDAQALMRRQDYRLVLDSGWYDYDQVVAIDCPLPDGSIA